MERENSSGTKTETSQIQNQISSILENQSVTTKEVTTTKESSKVVAYYDPTRYVYDETLKNPEVILEKTSTSGAVNAYYEYGAGGRYAKNGTQIYVYDGRGSVSEVTSSQSVVAQYRYDPYGNLLNGAVGQDQVYTYNAQQYTPQTGLQYLRARYYDASTGNFTSKDTYLGSQKSLVTQNRYTYGNNNPVSYQDPSGHAGLFSKIVSAAKSVVSTVVKTVTSVAKSVTKAVVNTVQKVVAAVQTAVKTVTTAVQSAAKTVASTAKAVVSAAKTKVTAAATAVKSAVSTASQMVSQVKSTLSSAAGAISSGATYVADAAQSAYTTVTAAISPAISRYNSSKVAVPMTQLDYTSIEDCAVPLSAALSDGAKGNIGVEEMQQSVGAWWLGGNGNSWKPIGANLLDSTSMNNYFYQTSLNQIPMLKDSIIENSELSTWNYIQKDFIKKDWETKFSSTGIFDIKKFNLPVSATGMPPSLEYYAMSGVDQGTGNSENSFWEDYWQGIKDSAFYDRVAMAKKHIENPMSLVWDATMLPANIMLAPLTVNIELVSVIAFGDSHDKAHYLGEQTEQLAEMAILYALGKAVDRIPRLNFIGKGGVKAVDDLPSGWTKTTSNGFTHIKDANGNIRVRIDPPDAKTLYPHKHLYDEMGNSLDVNGNIVSPKSPDAHIPLE